MQRLRDLLTTARGGSRSGPNQSTLRPGSLFAAGSVGERPGARDQRASAPAEDVTMRRRQRTGSSEDAPEAGIERRLRRPAPGGANAATATTKVRPELVAALRSPAALRTAVILREVLDAPIALRDERRER